jgi:hypothetical protein
MKENATLSKECRDASSLLEATENAVDKITSTHESYDTLFEQIQKKVLQSLHPGKHQEERDDREKFLDWESDSDVEGRVEEELIEFRYDNSPIKLGIFI